MITIKKYLSNSLQLMFIFAFIVMNFLTFNVYGDQSSVLAQDEKGNYLIKTEEDFHNFINMVETSDDQLKGKKIILNNDIIVETPNNCSDITNSFSGTFDGKGHTIEYKTDALQNYTTANSVFPFFLNGGVLKNTKININQCNIDAYFSGKAFPAVSLLVNSVLNESKIEGIQLTANTIISIGGDDFCGLEIGSFNCSGNSDINNCNISINYELSDSTNVEELINKIQASTKLRPDLELFQFGRGTQTYNSTFTSCYSNGIYGAKLIKLVEEWNKANIPDRRAGIIAQFMGANGKKSELFKTTNCYYNETRAPQLIAVCNLKKSFYQLFDKETYGRTTEQMKQQSTYEGFDFDKKWSISSDVNEGYPYYNPRTEEVVLKARPLVADKEWNTTSTKDKNKYGRTDTYYYPYCGDDNGTVTGVEFTDLTAEQQAYVEKYGISLNCDLEKDIESAKIDMNFLGVRPVQVTWKNQPTLTIADSDQAEDDGYEFSVEMVDGTANVTEMKGTENGIPEDQWDAYYAKAKEAIQVIMTYCEKNDNFGPMDSPSYENTNIWAIFTAARCGYVPYGDSTYFDRWFANTETYLQNLKDNGTDFTKIYKVTDIAKLALAIEAIGYDIRDISSVDLLTALGTVKDMDEGLIYKYEYMIHAIKAAGYSSTSKTFTDEDMKTWAIKCANGLKTAEDKAFVNADNSMGWQPLIYWYDDDPDIKAAIDSAEKRYPIIGQRATGAFCTYGYETGCPTYGNNAWNNAQALFFASEFNVNILDYASGYTKNGNNILDAVFDQINFEDTSYSESTLPGFFSYDPAQIARGLCSFVRSYERNIKNENVPAFWVFTDVDVPTKKVNDLILALNDSSTKEEIEKARNAYENLDKKYKAIFNKDILRKLLEAENGKGDSITKVIAAIDALPAADKLTLEDKDAVVKARTLYDTLDDESKTVISNYSKLTAAEAKIKELEKQQEQKEKDKVAAEKVIAAIDALPSADNLTLDPYVLQLLDNIQAQYNALTEAQKALVANYSVLQTLRSLIPDLKAAAAVVDKINAIGEVTSDNYQKKQALVIEARTAYDALTADQKKRVTNYAELEKAELFIRRQSTDAKVGYVISFIDELNITTSSTGALSDGPLKLTEKNNNVPTEKIWNSWKDYVANARALYNTLDDQQKTQVTNLSSLEKAEGYLYQLKSDALKAMLKALPDAETVRAYEAPQPTTVPAAQEAVQSDELPAQEVPAEGSDFSDGSADAFTSDISEQPAAQMDIQPSKDNADVSNEENTDSVIADEAEVPDADFSTEEEIPAAGDTAKRALTETELKQIAAAKNAYDQLTETEEKKFRSENTALVENMEKLIAMALTYEKGQNEYQQLFADEAALIYATVKDHPVDRDSYPQVKAFLDRYAKDYQGQENAMAGLKVKVGNQEMTFAEVIAALTAQADKAGKDISDAQQADDWISNLPTAVTKENIAGVEAELAALQKLIDSMSAEGKSYMWNAKQLELIKTIVADYHIELAGKQDAFKADMPANLQTKSLNYKTIQVSWSSVDNADGYMVYRRTETGSWKKIADQVTDISYKDQKAVTGRVYYYTVRAYSYTWGGKTVSSYDKDGVIGKAKLGKVKIAATDSENYTTIRVTWNKVSGANGYRVYRSASKDGKYTAIGSTAKNSAVTFLDKKAATGTTYYYKVRAYRNVNDKKIYGSSSTAVKGKAILSVPALSVGSTSKTAVLEWSKVKGADGYQVYASASKNGKYIRIKATKGTGMTEEKLATGKTRYYKVRAYRKVNGKAVYGSFSKVKKVVIK